MFASSELCKAFQFCLYPGIHGMGWRGAFSPKESKYCVKHCQDREMGQVSKKGGTEYAWREIGVSLEVRKDHGKRWQNILSNLQVPKPSELQSSVSALRSRLCHFSLLWFCYCSELLGSLFGNHCSGKAWLPLYIVPMYIVAVWQAFFLSYPFCECVFSMLNSHWQKLI